MDSTEFDKLWDYDNPSETETKFRNILPEIEKSGDKDLIAQLYTQIARTYGLRSKFDYAHSTLDSVLKMLDENTPVAEVRYMLERGRTYRSSGNPDKSRSFFLEAYQKSVERDLDYHAVDAAHMMVIIEKGDEALKWNDIAIRDAENSDDIETKGWLGSLYNNAGWTYFDMKNYEKSLDYFNKNVIWHTEKKTNKGLRIAKWSVARVNREVGKIEDALNIQLELLNDINEGRYEQDGYVYEELGELYLLKNETDKSKEYFSKAYEILSKDDWMMKNETSRIDRMFKLSR
ncbi:MAG TPA: hypothetical protein PLG90_05840 [Ignavibacteria bacterium]|nr:hypothetical protein [Ignavibacteria bacterium]